MDGPSLVVAGMMSGTSVDGVDVAIVTLPPRPDITAARSAVLHHRPFTSVEREAIVHLFDARRARPRDVCAMNFALGEWFAGAVVAAVDAAGIGALDLIGSHGQTVYHRPLGTALTGRRGGRGASARYRRAQLMNDDASGTRWLGETPCTLQLGEPAVIAERTGVTTVADFRVRDVAAGGHGAPLVSYVDALLFQHPAETRAVLNLGGIANVTILPARSLASEPVAFDTGPGNMVIDWLVAEATAGAMAYDDGGTLAAAGEADPALLAELLDDAYFSARPPKTTGRERYGARYSAALWRRACARGLRVEDTIATATALTATTVADAIRTAAPAGGVTEVIAGGGGTKNVTLMAEIDRRLGGVRLTTHEAYSVSSQAKEALSFAILAAACVRGHANTVPACTGADHPVVLGKIVPGGNYRSLMAKLFGTAGTAGEAGVADAAGTGGTVV